MSDKCKHCQRCVAGCKPCACCGVCQVCGMPEPTKLEPYRSPVAAPPTFIPVPYPVPQPTRAPAPWPSTGPIWIAPPYTITCTTVPDPELWAKALGARQLEPPHGQNIMGVQYFS